METSEAGFGNTLLMLWISYGLAKKEGRAFFIDDTRWPYGKYTSYFPAIPQPSCSAPPPSHILPCPRHARHLLVSAATASRVFGRSFSTEFVVSRRHGPERQKQVFDLLRAGYKDLFQLVGDDAPYLDRRIRDLKNRTNPNAAIIGLHIRRGDCHTHELQFSRDYLPLDKYTSAATDILARRISNARDSSNGLHLTAASDIASLLNQTGSKILLASDDPDLYPLADLSFTTQAQDRITLASKTTLDKSDPKTPIRADGSAYTKHIDENIGWEGGFFSSLFWSLGQSSTSSLTRLSRLPSFSGPYDSETDTEDESVPEPVMQLRNYVGRAYLLDLAVLGQSSDEIVCAVSSAACRILAVMMGWDALKEGRWKNVDGGTSWSWDGN
ncbi:hypothetical protein LTR66_000426 [Elasticomyces elasticus]|nr:hypothetical protein LTR66_000426 [Elasticomyces elasticus]